MGAGRVHWNVLEDEGVTIPPPFHAHRFHSRGGTSGLSTIVRTSTAPDVAGGAASELVDGVDFFALETGIGGGG